MKYYGRFRELPLAALAPQGWLRKYLETQRDGLTGHIDECGYPFDTPGWSADRVSTSLLGDCGWGPYEQTGYWADGAIRCGHLLRDARLIAKARRPIDSVLWRAQPDGYLGPSFLKKGFRWPHAVFFRALMAEHSATGDRRIPAALRRHYLSGTSRHSDGREVCNVEPMLWAYARTGDRRLLAEAARAFAEYNVRFPEMDTSLKLLLSDERATEHGVTFCELGKLGAILYLYTGDRRCLAAAEHGWRKLDRDQMLIDGVPSSTENLRGKDPLDAHETCDIADYTWSTGYLLLATGAAAYADRLERACFNAAPGAVRADFRALQYFSCPNQVLADRQSCHRLYQRGTDWSAFLPRHEVQCCPGEVHRIMPNFVARMWLDDGAGGLVAALYGPSRVAARVGPQQQTVAITEETAYPFSEQIDFRIDAAAPVAFALGLRIPGWCRGARVALNDRPLPVACRAGTFVRLRRTFRPGDRVTLTLPMTIALSHWPRGGVGIERGPLVYVLGIPERWRAYQRGTSWTTPDFPAWDVCPAGPWNYALDLSARELGQAVEVVAGKATDNPWTPKTAPVRLRVPARRVAGWALDRRREIETVWYQPGYPAAVRRKGCFAFTPQLPNAATLRKRLGRRRETLTLVPYGCARLRIAVFPDARGG